MIKIEFPAGDGVAALVFGNALLDYAGQQRDARHAHIGNLPSLDERLRYRVTDATGSTYMSNVDQATIDANERDDLARSAACAAGGVLQVNTSTGEVIEPELPANPGDAMRLDLKGVPFDAKYCANAADPFYGSGKEKGQWKAKRGLAAGVYEGWYTQQLAAAPSQLAPADEDTDHTPTVATGQAFGAVQSTLAPAPQTAGEFMAWVSEKQTAGKLAQDVINGAYVALGIRVQDLFAPTLDSIVVNNVRALHQYLVQVAGA